MPNLRLGAAYSYGVPTGKAAARDVMLTCPQAAIQDSTWEMLVLWQSCRLMKALPLAGGWLDQPAGIREAFPVFEAEAQAAERAMKQHAAMQGGQSTAALLAVMAGLAGKR